MDKEKQKNTSTFVKKDISAKRILTDPYSKLVQQGDPSTKQVVGVIVNIGDEIYTVQSQVQPYGEKALPENFSVSGSPAMSSRDLANKLNNRTLTSFVEDPAGDKRIEFGLRDTVTSVESTVFISYLGLH